MNKSLINSKDITSNGPLFATRLAVCADDTQAAQALRYRVFVEEMGADGPLVDHDARLERDIFDDHAEQLLLLDLAREDGDQVVGVYRLMDEDAAQAAGQFYSAQEFDLTRLTGSGRRLMELGRSCLHPDYRGGAGVLHLWQGLADIVRTRQIDILFGVASFQGTDLETLAPSLSLLHRDHLAPDDIRVRAHDFQPMDFMGVEDRVAAMKQVPSLIKAYLRLGGFVGEGAYVDPAFNTTDVCLVLDLARMTARQAAIYGGVR
ncbi:MAG: GNAT family N-acetyltransferase [Octadecabacter sp.]